MSDTPKDSQPKGPFRALMEWLKGEAPPGGGVAERTPSGVIPPTGVPALPSRRSHVPALKRLGHYQIERKLGEGGMGVVYAARDEKLRRAVALKTMSSLAQDENARKRFWREARAAAAVNHPNICQIYEIGEDDNVLFIAMELLEGAPLSERLKSAPLSVGETVSTGLGILNALSALHARGVIHRDLKPSNVFLTPHGVKLLDFGLARPTVHEQATGAADLTRAGAVMGTPRYMSPEQALGETLDGRTDLFSTGAILFEMLAGRPAFTGNTVVAILHATVYEQPPALTGSPAVAAVDRVIRRALAKKASERPRTADAMADELRDVPTADDATATMTHPMTRIVVLPFRVLRADPDTDFLAFSLPDAITTSLAGIGSLVVRSSATAARFANEAPDFKALAAEAGVDRVVSGTILRAGDELRTHVQLIEAPGGTVITSHSVQAPLGDLFQLQDDLARRVVEALALPLGGANASPSPDAPASPRAYELYLRGNEVGRGYSGVIEARDLYERSVALDPTYAPAWARLGRCYRLIGKYIESSPGSVERARQAYDRALELNPKLTIAHKFYANLESDIGQADRAVVRLLNAATRHGNDPELFSGLVHACRYAGLYDESLAAHAEARRLDPSIPTSFEQTLMLTGDVERMISTAFEADASGADDGIRVIAMGLHGRRDDAKAALAQMKEQPKLPLFKTWTEHLHAWLDRRAAQMLEEIAKLTQLAIFDDPEAIFQEGWLLCDVGAHEKGLPFLERGVERGYLAAPVLKRAPQFDPLRGTPAFESLLADAEARRQRALHAFREAGGERLLGRRDAR
ncbi:MAG TPA: protein kinase [Vicinamibacterales bacterium]|nr:protein kinase [Vicinamibacterales bacterium]